MTSARRRPLTVFIGGFNTREVKWSPDGKALLLLGKETFCCAFEVENENQPLQF